MVSPKQSFFLVTRAPKYKKKQKTTYLLKKSLPGLVGWMVGWLVVCLVGPKQGFFLAPRALKYSEGSLCAKKNPYPDWLVGWSKAEIFFSTSRPEILKQISIC